MNPFFVGRSDALKDPELQKQPSVFMTLCAITTYTTREKDGHCYFKQSTLAEQLGKSRQAISKQLQTLQDLGYIRIFEQNYGGRQSNNKYQVLYDTPLKNTVQPDVAAVQPDVAHAVQPEVAPKCRYINTKNKKRAGRDEFLREVNKRFHAGEYERFNASESWINSEGHDAYDRWEGYGFPPNCLYAAFKGWLKRAKTEHTLNDHRKKNLQSKAAGHDPDAKWKARVKIWMEKGTWTEHDGCKPPDHPQTKVPAGILQEFKINQPKGEKNDVRTYHD